MSFVFKRMNFALNVMTFALQTMNFVLKTNMLGFITADLDPEGLVRLNV